MQSWVWAPESHVLPGQSNSQQKADGRETKCMHFFQLNLFIPLSKHKSVMCWRLMDYVKGGLCSQHLLIDLANCYPLWWKEWAGLVQNGNRWARLPGTFRTVQTTVRCWFPANRERDAWWWLISWLEEKKICWIRYLKKKSFLFKLA